MNIKPMYPANKVEWLEALRSGRYKQDCGYLRTHDGFCCLGVLADVQGIDWDGYVGDDTMPEDVKDEFYTNMDDSVWQLASLPSHLACGMEQHIQSILSNMNDRGMPFDQIADWIEGQL